MWPFSSSRGAAPDTVGGTIPDSSELWPFSFRSSTAADEVKKEPEVAPMPPTPTAKPVMLSMQQARLVIPDQPQQQPPPPPPPPASDNPQPVSRNLAAYSDSEVDYLLTSMAAFASNTELTDGRIAELETGAADVASFGFFPPMADDGSSLPKVELATLKLLEQVMREKAYAEKMVEDLEAQRDLDMEAARELRKQLAAAEACKARDGSANERLTQRAEADSKTIADLRNQLTSVEALKKRADDDRERAETALARVSADFAKLRADQADADKGKADTGKQLAAANAEKEEMRLLLLDARDAYATSLADVADLKQKLSENHAATVAKDREKESEIDGLKSQLSGALATASDLERRVQEAGGNTAEVTDLKSQLAEMTFAKAAGERQNAQLQSSINFAEDEAARLRGQLTDAHRTASALEDRLQAAENTMVRPSAVKAKQDKLDAAERTIAELQAVQQAQQAEIATLKQRVAELGDGDSIPAPSIVNATELNKLHRDIEALKSTKASLETQSRIDHETIASLRSTIESLRAQEAQSKQDEEEVDKKRVRDLKVINDNLLKFALDGSFQEDLKRPLVIVALNCWGGTGSNIPEDQLEAARTDPG